MNASPDLCRGRRWHRGRLRWAGSLGSGRFRAAKAQPHGLEYSKKITIDINGQRIPPLLGISCNQYLTPACWRLRARGCSIQLGNNGPFGLQHQAVALHHPNGRQASSLPHGLQVRQQHPEIGTGLPQRHMRPEPASQPRTVQRTATLVRRQQPKPARLAVAPSQGARARLARTPNLYGFRHAQPVHALSR